MKNLLMILIASCALISCSNKEFVPPSAKWELGIGGATMLFENPNGTITDIQNGGTSETMGFIVLRKTGIQTGGSEVEMSNEGGIVLTYAMSSRFDTLLVAKVVALFKANDVINVKLKSFTPYSNGTSYTNVLTSTTDFAVYNYNFTEIYNKLP